MTMVLGAVLHFILEEDSPHKLVEMLTAAVAPGSYLVISYATSEDLSADIAGRSRTCTRRPAPRPYSGPGRRSAGSSRA